MSWLIVGTVPDKDFPLVHGEARLEGEWLVVDKHRVSVARGTPALTAAACIVAKRLGLEPPQVLLAGDIGKGEGSRKIYAYLSESVAGLKLDGFTFHYLQPDIYWHNQVLWAIQASLPDALLVADAGFMYVAKMSGFASDYHLFTPDIGEMCFLADEKAPHPFYTRGFILQDESKVEEYIARAYQEGNAAKNLMVKGAMDYVVKDGEIVHTISEPSIAAMEAIGGTGDSLTGFISAYLMAGEEMSEACLKAAIENRRMGEIAQPDPSFSIAKLLNAIA